MAVSKVAKLLFFLIFCVLVNVNEAGVSWTPDGMTQLSSRYVAKISKIADKSFKKEMEKLLEEEEEKREEEEEEEAEEEEAEEEEEEEEGEEEGEEEEIIEYPPPEMTPPPPEFVESTPGEDEENETAIDTSAECNITIGYLWELCRPVLLKTCKDQYKTVCSTNRRKFHNFARHLDRLFPKNSPPSMLTGPEPLTDWIAEQVSELGQEIGDNNFQVSISFTDGSDTRTYTSEDFDNDLRNLTDFIHDKIQTFNRKYQTTFGNIIGRILDSVFPRRRGHVLPESKRRSDPLVRIPKSAPGRYKRHSPFPRGRHGNYNQWHRRSQRMSRPHFMGTQPRNDNPYQSQTFQDPWRRHREMIEKMTQKHAEDWKKSMNTLNGLWRQGRMGMRPPQLPVGPHHFPRHPTWNYHFPRSPIRIPHFQNTFHFSSPPHFPWRIPDEEDEDEDEEEEGREDEDEDEEEEDREDFSISCEQVEEDPEICIEIVERTEKCEAELERVCPDYIQARRDVKERLDRVYALSQQAKVDRVINEEEEGPEVNERYEWRSLLSGDEPSILVESININRAGSGDAYVRAKIFGESPFEFRVPGTQFRMNPSSLGKAISRMALMNYRGRGI